VFLFIITIGVKDETEPNGSDMKNIYWRWVGIEGDLERARKLSLLNILKSK
jgi:hypothetical protein